MNPDGKLGKVAPKDFDSSKHIPISNSQLLSYRQRNDDLAFSDKIFGETGMDVIGMGDIRKELDEMINNLGSIKTSNPQVQKLSDIASDLQGIGVFQVAQKYDKGDLADFSQLLYSRLSTEAKHLIDANAAISGYDKYKYILGIIRSETDSDTSTTFDASLTKASSVGSSGGNGSKGPLKPDTYQIRFANGEGGTQVTVSLVPTASKISDKAGLMVQGLDYGPMLDFDELPLEPMNLQRMLFTGGKKASALATSVRSTDVTFGTKLLDETELPAVMYAGRGLTTKVYLPYEEKNGHFTPNFKVIEGFNKYKKAIKDHPDLSTTEKNSLLQKCGLNPQDIIEQSDGTIKLSRVMPFLSFSAYVGDDTIKFNNNEEHYLAKVDRSKGRIIADMYNNSVVYDSTYAKKDATKIRKAYGKSEANDFWEGLVFIPVPSSAYAYNNTSNQYVSPEEFNDVSARV